jgi:hypothetical protein
MLPLINLWFSRVNYLWLTSDFPGLIDFQFHLIFTYMVCHFITVGIHHMFFLSIWTYKDIYIYIILSMICHFTSVGAIICFYCGKLKISKVIMIVTFLIKLWPNTANLYNCVYYFWSSQIIGFKLIFKSSYRGDRKLLGCWKYLVDSWEKWTSHPFYLSIRSGQS